MSTGLLLRAFYRHPAFLPHCLLGELGVSIFLIGSAIVTDVCVLGLTFAAWMD